MEGNFAPAGEFHIPLPGSGGEFCSDSLHTKTLRSILSDIGMEPLRLDSRATVQAIEELALKEATDTKTAAHNSQLKRHTRTSFQLQQSTQRKNHCHDTKVDIRGQHQTVFRSSFTRLLWLGLRAEEPLAAEAGAAPSCQAISMPVVSLGARWRQWSVLPLRGSGLAALGGTAPHPPTHCWVSITGSFCFISQKLLRRCWLSSKCHNLGKCTPFPGQLQIGGNYSSTWYFVRHRVICRSTEWGLFSLSFCEKRQKDACNVKEPSLHARRTLEGHGHCQQPLDNNLLPVATTQAHLSVIVPVTGVLRTTEWKEGNKFCPMSSFWHKLR